MQARCAQQTLRESQANTASAADSSEEASQSTRTQCPSQTEPDVFLFLLSTLVWHPQLTDGYFPSLQNNRASGKGNTSSLASPAPGLQINRLTLAKKDEALDTPRHLPLAGRQQEKNLTIMPREQLDTKELWFPDAKAPAPASSGCTCWPHSIQPQNLPLGVWNSPHSQATAQAPTCHPAS